MKKIISIYLSALFLFTGCLEDEPKFEPTKEPTETAIVEYKADWSSKEWTKILSSAIDQYGGDMLKVTPSDASTYGLKGDRKQFYIMLISSMARYESSFAPTTTYRECNKTKCVYSGGCQYSAQYGYCMKSGSSVDGGIIISRGLLQMSYSSAKNYGCSFLTKPEDLHDVTNNLKCSVIILNKWVTQDKVIGTDKKGGARYWSVLRESSASRPKIIAKTKAL